MSFAGGGLAATLAAKRKLLQARMPRAPAPRADPYAAARTSAAAAMVAASRRR